jgi:hypothetical protein
MGKAFPVYGESVMADASTLEGERVRGGFLIFDVSLPVYDRQSRPYPLLRECLVQGNKRG